ncbi:hypothetical protein HK105_202995 [Polyrhizophydium stewartii]|uniref:tRNA N(3)-methylcytidine methyltransferase n=1 Tax=Polyrhizophydium stewartii TaxID=2732419 RepID=A0ABR4NCX4_9FUNG
MQTASETEQPVQPAAPAPAQEAAPAAAPAAPAGQHHQAPAVYEDSFDPASEARYQEMLAKQHQPARALSEFKRTKLEADAARNWDIFYKNNTTNFFKDRHWTHREFVELRETGDALPRSRKLLEIGCGVGNFVFPLLQTNKELFIYACDFSPRAVEFVKASPDYDEACCKAFVNDITADALADHIPAESLDLVSAIYVLSALPPHKMQRAVENIRSVLRPGGVVLFRDYGLYDAAQLRFKAENRIDDRFYARHDGTFSYYFSTEFAKELFGNAGFEVLECAYVKKEFVNRKEDLHMERVFLQARFQKK